VRECVRECVRDGTYQNGVKYTLLDHLLDYVREAGRRERQKVLDHL